MTFITLAEFPVNKRLRVIQEAACLDEEFCNAALIGAVFEEAVSTRGPVF